MSDFTDAQLFVFAAVAALTIFGIVFFWANAAFDRAERRQDERDLMAANLDKIVRR